MLLRSQQRELTELRGQIEAMQSSIMSQVEHVLASHQEQERILVFFFFFLKNCPFLFAAHVLK